MLGEGRVSELRRQKKAFSEGRAMESRHQEAISEGRGIDLGRQQKLREAKAMDIKHQEECLGLLYLPEVATRADSRASSRAS